MKKVCYSFFMLVSLVLLYSCDTKRHSATTTIPTDTLPAAEIVGKKIVRPKVPKEMRAVWLTTIYNLDWPTRRATTVQAEASQREELCRILDRLAADHFNTVFLQVRHRGDVIYPSQYEPYALAFSGSRSSMGYDPLSFAIEECHKRGLQIHAWMVTFPLGNDRSSNHPPRSNHPSWCVKHRGEWQLNPGLPEVRAYIASLVRELVDKYPNLDGVHMDYVRYPDFAERFNDTSAFRKYCPQGTSRDEWRRGNITDLMKRINDVVRKDHPSMMISCATLGRLKRLPEYPNIGWTCYEDVYQDPLTWSKLGLVDFVVPMMYHKGDYFFPFLDDWQAHSDEINVVPGLGVYRIDEGRNSWDPKVIDEQMTYCREKGMPGICFYREANLTANKQIEEIVKRQFEEPVAPICRKVEPTEQK
ncbi:glycoside hydrolase family 10 protein [Falsiporphyromonas endometrii]|uniref:Glycoside hydrolase family 10 protein n=1 Tax=Falsiporphyromonas endometrii TaxID=1387297 RepID=A0ABV9K7H9_9PORP